MRALELRMPSAEEPTRYGERPAGSVSKLSTYRDGVRILALIANLIRNERPLQFFGLTGLGMIVIAFLLALPLVETYLETRLVPRLPTAVLVVSLVIIGVLSCLAGLTLDTVTTMRHEMKRLAYLTIPPFSPPRSTPLHFIGSRRPWAGSKSAGISSDARSSSAFRSSRREGLRREVGKQAAARETSHQGLKVFERRSEAIDVCLRGMLLLEQLARGKSHLFEGLRRRHEVGQGATDVRDFILHRDFSHSAIRQVRVPS